MPKTVLPNVEDSHIERALRLPQRTFQEQMGNDPTVDQLVKIIRLFPWMLEVADAGFDPITAKQALVVAAATQTVQDLEKLRTPPELSEQAEDSALNR